MHSVFGVLTLSSPTHISRIQLGDSLFAFTPTHWTGISDMTVCAHTRSALWLLSIFILFFLVLPFTYGRYPFFIC